MSTLVRGRRAVLGIAAGAALMTTGGLLATAFVKSPAQLAAETGPPPQGPLLAEVERRVLAETVVMRGTVVAGQTVQVAPQGGEGRAVVTRLPVAAGAPVRAGQVVAEVSGRPVCALPGALPGYRDLRPGAVGADVAQLQRALRGLGHPTGGDPAGVFGAGTKAALAAHYRAVGYDPLPAVADGGAAVAAARTAVRDARWALEDAEAVAAAAAAPDGGGTGPDSPGTPAPTVPGPGRPTAPGSPGPGGSPGSPGPGAGAPERRAKGSLRREVARARETLAAARAELAAAEAAAGPMLPAAEVVYVRSFPARVSRIAAAVGAPATGPVLTLSAGELVVEAYLKDDKRLLLRPGQPVTVSSEAAGKDVRGTVRLVATERTTGRPPSAAGAADPGAGTGPGDGAGGGPVDLGYRMVVRPDRPLPAEFAGQDVRLTVEAAATQGPALVVPVTAVSAGADGRTVVTAVDAAGDPRRVEVRTGTTGDGFVEVAPAVPGALVPGTRVVTGTAPGAPR
ncbi:hypothetical protein [Streptomyces sp. NRRL S-87]|uniref:hypothetical protein n=1 Tax=Streptomyces sp. NRRL S-87 TaxID=1463920 RepID=UPI00056617D3|nr:hypothetical protein [Streptomyces sp. NRRL S-87]